MKVVKEDMSAFMQEACRLFCQLFVIGGERGPTAAEVTQVPGPALKVGNRQIGRKEDGDFSSTVPKLSNYCG